MIHFSFRLMNEMFLHWICPNSCGTCNSFSEVAVNYIWEGSNFLSHPFNSAVKKLDSYSYCRITDISSIFFLNIFFLPVNRGSGYGFQSLQLPWCCNVKPLNHIVQNSSWKNHTEKDRSTVRDDSNSRNHLKYVHIYLSGVWQLETSESKYPLKN